MKNGWLPLSKARDLGYTCYETDKNPQSVMLWVRSPSFRKGYMMTGVIFETPEGLEPCVDYHAGSVVKVVAFQPIPNGPFTK